MNCLIPLQIQIIAQIKLPIIYSNLSNIKKGETGIAVIIDIVFSFDCLLICMYIHYLIYRVFVIFPLYEFIFNIVVVIHLE